MHGPHATSSSRTPALISFVIRPERRHAMRTDREPGDTAIERPGWTCFPLRISATIARSRNEEFTLLPTATWVTSVPATSVRGFTFPGVGGHAIGGSISERSSSIRSSYVARSSGPSRRQSLGRFCPRKNRSVIPSLGNTDPVAPSSAPMFAIVPRSGTVNRLIPGPSYSTIFSFPHFSPYRRSISRITSFADVQGGSSPVRSTRTTWGIRNRYGSPAITEATSNPPAPIASIPVAPAWTVWLSHPSIVWPGTSNRSMWVQWLIPFPGRGDIRAAFAHMPRRHKGAAPSWDPVVPTLWSPYLVAVS